MNSVTVITLDSLRWDVADKLQINGETPNINKLGRWRKCYAPGHYTLPSHISMLRGGIFPENHGMEAQYNREKFALFGFEGWGRVGRFQMPVGSSSIVDGFNRLGYHTVGMGGVGWFSDRPTSLFWSGMFQWWDYDEDYSEQTPNSLERQIDSLVLMRGAPTFLFWNISSTHRPYRGAGAKPAIDAQEDALRYVDSHFDDILDALPMPCTLILCADHGDCFGEDGLWGHGFYHQKVMEVPMMIVDIG